MTRMESEEETMLALGRGALAPSPADRARVRASLRSALAAALPHATDVPEAPVAGDSGTASGIFWPNLGVAKAWVARLGTAALIGILGTGVGYWAGYRAGLTARSAQSSPPPARPPLSSAPSASVAASASSVPPSEQVVTRPARPARTSAAPHRSEAPAPRPALPEAPVDEELRTLRRAERALRQGNPRLALVLLEELSRSTRGGRLLEERAAEMVIARCALEPSEGARLSLEFERTHSESVYLDRVKQSCLVERE